jgi:hypothetical protein
MQINDEDRHLIGVLVILVMSIWGGFVNHLGRLRRGEVNMVKRYQELFIDIATSSFSGVIIGLPLLAAGFDPLWCFAISGIGGHAGARLIFKLERLLFNRVDSFNDKS